MNSKEAIFPSHYEKLAVGLAGLSQYICQELLNRPAPQRPAWDFPGEIMPLSDRMQQAFQLLVKKLNIFSDQVLPPSKSLSGNEVQAAVAALSMPVEQILEIYRELWRLPFPEGMEPGQYLIRQ